MSVTLEDLLLRVEALEAQIDLLVDPPPEEEKRIARWWASYNAALTKAGIYQHGPTYALEEMLITHQRVHYCCRCYADYAHGPLNVAVPAGAQFNEMPPGRP